MKTNNQIKLILKKYPYGLTITDIVKKSKLSRSTIRNMLSRLEGAGEIRFIKIGMAKIYTLNKRNKGEKNG